MDQVFRQAVRCVIVNEEWKILLAKHKNHWAIPWGWLHFWESLFDVVFRESVEELGIAAEMDKIIFVQDYRGELRWKDTHFLELFCSIKNNEDFRGVEEVYKNASHSFELEHIAWFWVEEFPENFLPLALPRILKKYILNKELFSCEYVSCV